jgi:hypothetical protein
VEGLPPGVGLVLLLDCVASPTSRCRFGTGAPEERRTQRAQRFGGRWGALWRTRDPACLTRSASSLTLASAALCVLCPSAVQSIPSATSAPLGCTILALPIAIGPLPAPAPNPQSLPRASSSSPPGIVVPWRAGDVVRRASRAPLACRGARRRSLAVRCRAAPIHRRGRLVHRRTTRVARRRSPGHRPPTCAGRRGTRSARPRSLVRGRATGARRPSSQSARR